MLKLHNDAGWRSSHSSSQVGERNATATSTVPAANFGSNTLGMADGGKVSVFL